MNSFLVIGNCQIFYECAESARVRHICYYGFVCELEYLLVFDKDGANKNNYSLKVKPILAVLLYYD